MKRIAFGVSVLVGLGGPLLAAGPAKADVSAADRNVAQSLFDEAKDLMAAGKFAEACPKLEESERLDPGGGTMINVALCHESLGRTATAWSDFKEALSLARRDGRPDRAQAAQEHIATLQPNLPRVTLAVTAASPDEQLTLDGALVSSAGWGRPTPLDPGPHQLTVAAPGKKPWLTEFDLSSGEQKTVTVPALEVDPTAGAPLVGVGVAPTTAPLSPAESDDAEAAVRKRRTVGFIVGGAGVAALGVGAVFGVQALSKRSQSNAECPSDTTCTAKGVSLNDDAKTFAWVANIGVGLGLVGVGVGTYLVITAGKGHEAHPAQVTSSARRLWFDANALPNGGRVTVGGAW